jgi:carbamoylphosphate synthase large subunit
VAVQLDIIETPFIIKPSVGFFSLGVYKVNSTADWEQVVDNLTEEVENTAHNYPPEVINTNQFIIEENIEGEEFAVDLYYDREGKPVILNILQHIFSSGEDVSDRVYITSKEIIEDYHDLFADFLSTMGDKADFKNFPLHIEFRVNE